LILINIRTLFNHRHRVLGPYPGGYLTLQAGTFSIGHRRLENLLDILFCDPIYKLRSWSWR
jgi:hypothetical protein